MLFPIILPQYRTSTKEIVEVDKHVDTVTIRKDLFDKYEKFYQELSKFPNRNKFECRFEQINNALRYCGNYQYSIQTDDLEEFVSRIEKLNSTIIDKAIFIEKEVETHRSSLGIIIKNLSYELEYIKSKWWFKLFFNKKECDEFIMDRKMKNINY